MPTANEGAKAATGVVSTPLHLTTAGFCCTNDWALNRLGLPEAQRASAKGRLRSSELQSAVSARIVSPMPHPTLDAWHRLVETRDPKGLDDLLADECTFHSPVVHTPQVGKAISKIYLTAAMEVLGQEGFHYVREIVSGNDAMLEFRQTIDGIEINGVDILRWNDAGRIIDFKVMIRPLKAIQLLHAKMGEYLARMKGGR